MAKQSPGGLLKFVPIPLLDSLVKGMVIPFVGAGFSRNCVAPDGFVVPDWKMLGVKAAEKLNGYEYDDNPLEALSVFEDCCDRPSLVEFIRDTCGLNLISPGPAHRAFCHCFQDIVCTTNFDTLLEQAYRDLRLGLQVITDEAGLAVSNPGVTILKIHGDCDHPQRLVATEHDYDLFIAKNPLMSTYVSSLFITKTMLLVGYSLDDYDMRQLLSIVKDRLGENSRTVYCVQLGAKPSDISKFERRGVKVINLPVRNKSEYSSVMERFFVELQRYIDEQAERLTSCNTEEGRNELIRPKSNNNLCYIGCSITRTAMLKRLLGPVLQASNLVPIWSENVVANEVSKNSAFRAVVRKATVRIFDISDANPYVSSLLNASLEDDRRKTITICEFLPNMSIDSSKDSKLDKSDILHYSAEQSLLNIVEESLVSDFRKSIQNRIQECVSSYRIPDSVPLNDAESLLKQGFYNASLLSAFAQLESILRVGDVSSRGRSLKELCNDKLYDDERLRLARYISLRNNIVHGYGDANEKDAIEVIKIVRGISESHRVNERDDSLVRDHITSRSCEIFISVTMTPWDVTSGPTRNTIYPADWLMYNLPKDALSNDESFKVFVENKVAQFVMDYTGCALVNWIPNESIEQSPAFDYAFQASCTNPFNRDQSWFVTAWVKFVDS